MTEFDELLPTTVPGAPTLVEGIQFALRAAISDGSLPAGYRLREIPLAEHFGCSTTPVREAIRKLESEGLVKLYPRRGAEVTALTDSEVDHLYETRMVLETYIARKAAERKPSDADLAPLRDLLERQSRDIGDDSGPALDADFHQMVAKLGGNPVIAELVARSTRQIEAVQSRTDAAVEGGAEHAYTTHTAIYEAIAAGDADAAERVMREHLQWAADAVGSALEQTRSG